MLDALQVSDVHMLSEEQTENFEIFEADQPEDNYYPMVFSIEACPSEEEDYDPLNLEQYFKRREEHSKLNNQRKSERNQLSKAESTEYSENPIFKEDSQQIEQNSSEDNQLKSEENLLLNTESDECSNNLRFKNIDQEILKGNPLLEMEIDSQLKSKRNPLLNETSKNRIYFEYFKSYQFKKHPLLEIGTNIRLKLKRNPFFKNSPGINYIRPP